MSRNKNARQVNYVVKRDRSNECYYIIVGGKLQNTINKKERGWYACTMYHQTLRDAIIYCLYGV